MQTFEKLTFNEVFDFVISDALKAIKLKLVGPFDVLAGNVSEVYEEDLPDLLRHWRFYYDPPEFQVNS